ncbi:hypothetical protein Tco_0974115 [Tanacetum coccineum]|uniref:Uncharacterized protein n=1 Tax=Tanacetum coccineum TaxID=301880 RepID=A0ABQ5EAM6_9ASTR
MSSLKEDIYFIKTMMYEMYEVFKGQSSSSVTPTLALTHIPANIKRENATNNATKKPPSYIEGEIKHLKMAVPISSIQPTKVPPTQAQPITTITTHLESSQAAPRIDKGKGTATKLDKDPSKKLVPASTIVRPDPDEEVKVPYMINGKMCYLTDKEMQAYLDREEKLKKAAEEERLLAISKPEVIKVVQEEAEKIGLNPKKLQVPKQVKSSKRLKMLNTRSSRENTLRSLQGIDGRNFDVHKPFAFGAFGISELDEVREMIPKKKNTVSNIEKVGMEALVSYLVAASMVKSLENARFSMKLRKLIAEHPDQEKLKSKKVKLEALGYEMN